MTDRKILVVKHSWGYFVVHSEEAGILFYEKLFELDPNLRPLFKSYVKAQAKKLMDMVTLVIVKLQKLEDIEREVSALSKRHIHYGVRPEHYQTVSKALLWTLENGLGNRWSDEMRDAWTEVYDLIADGMIKSTPLHRI